MKGHTCFGYFKSKHVIIALSESLSSREPELCAGNVVSIIKMVHTFYGDHTVTEERDAPSSQLHPAPTHVIRCLHGRAAVFIAC